MEGLLRNVHILQEVASKDMITTSSLEWSEKQKSSGCKNSLSLTDERLELLRRQASNNASHDSGCLSKLRKNDS